MNSFNVVKALVVIKFLKKICILRKKLMSYLFKKKKNKHIKITLIYKRDIFIIKNYITCKKVI